MTEKDQLRNNTRAYMELIREFPETKFNLRTSPDHWSAADITEHLYRSEFGIPRLFKGETKAVEQTDPDRLSKIPAMEERFLNDDTKIEAKGVILPTPGDKQMEPLLAKFEKNRNAIAELIDTLPPDEICLMYEHPMLGFLSRKEWVIFSIIHTQRHMKQLKRVRQELNLV